METSPTALAPGFCLPGDTGLVFGWVLLYPSRAAVICVPSCCRPAESGWALLGSRGQAHSSVCGGQLFKCWAETRTRYKSKYTSGTRVLRPALERQLGSPARGGHVPGRTSVLAAAAALGQQQRCSRVCSRFPPAAAASPGSSPCTCVCRGTAVRQALSWRAVVAVPLL